MVARDLKCFHVREYTRGPSVCVSLYTFQTGIGKYTHGRTSSHVVRSIHELLCLFQKLFMITKDRFSFWSWALIENEYCIRILKWHIFHRLKKFKNVILVWFYQKSNRLSHECFTFPFKTTCRWSFWGIWKVCDELENIPLSHTVDEPMMSFAFRKY